MALKKMVKKPMMKKYQPGGILTPEGRIKSNKTRNIDLTGRQTTADVSRTKRNGDTVTKSVNTSRGFVPTASKTKTVTNKSGDVVSKETKSIGYNKAVRKTNRVANNVGRNANDTYAYKKGGVIKKPLRKAQNGFTDTLGKPTGPVDYLPAPKSKDTNIYQGPINKGDTEALNENYPATTGSMGSFKDTPGSAKKGYINPKDAEQYYRNNDENYLRSGAADVKRYNESGNNGNYPTTNQKTFKKGGVTKKTTYKTGGMVNANANLKAGKVAGSKGVKSGVNPKAAASKVVRGRVGGTSVAPKKAIPKAKYGMSMKGKK
tara:strand:- start:35 stop:988 length:954 start_codon:yes stop_codon:yes gene_type:complete